MKASLFVVALFCVSAALAANPPTWPTQYLTAGVFSIPYFNITEPLRQVYDGVNSRQRFDYYNGMDTYIYTPTTNYEIVPRIDTRTCFQSPGSSSDLIMLLPDLTAWTYIGQDNLNGTVYDHWQQIVKNLNKTNTYDFWMDGANNVPIKLVMAGYDYVFGSHPDIYILDYDVWMPGYQNPNEFVPPQLCSSAQENTGVAAKRNAHYVRQLFPTGAGLQGVDKLFAEHVKKYGKVYASEAEYVHRMNVFADNLAYIEMYNREKTPLTGITLAMNHFGDLEHAEYRELVLPRRGGQHSRASRVHLPPRSLRDVPAAIDWRKLGAVTMVKDQGVCGSCWSFGATGSIEGINFVTNRQLVSLSEQQVIGCAWGDRYGGSAACDGGQSWGAFQWAIDNGGVATEQSYPYLMQDSYCNKAVQDSGVKVIGYVNVTMGSEEALQEAVASAGPVSVAIDAAHPEFEFYSSGVYYNPQCKNGIDDLDHAVLAVGYGTDSTGADYWIVKNSWSTHWGNKGYIHMARNRQNNCGIATQAAYPVVAQH